MIKSNTHQISQRIKHTFLKVKNKYISKKVKSARKLPTAARKRFPHFHKEVRKYPILYGKSCKCYMMKDANNLSVKRCYETIEVFFL